MIGPPWAAELAKAVREVTRHCVLKHGGGQGSRLLPSLSKHIKH